MEQNKVFRLLGLATRAGKISFGTQSSIEAIQKRKAKLVLIAENASDRTKKNISIVAKENIIPYRVYGTIEQLSKNIGKENKAIIVIKDINFAKEILKIIDGGEVIG